VSRNGVVNCFGFTTVLLLPNSSFQLHVPQPEKIQIEPPYMTLRTVELYRYRDDGITSGLYNCTDTEMTEVP
jgi:hypothetical protein